MMGCAKCILITINFFVVGLGLSVVCTAGSIMYQSSLFGVVLTNLLYWVPLTALLSGLFITCLGVLGCLGAIKQNPIMLLLYAGIVLVLLLVVAVAGISILVFVANISTSLARGLNGVFSQYGDEGKEDLTYNINMLQHTTHCCGTNSYKDWAKFPYFNGTSVADGCCKNMTEDCGKGVLQQLDVKDLIFTTGCLHYVREAFDVICLRLGILIFALIAVKVVAIISACITRNYTRRYQQLLD